MNLKIQDSWERIGNVMKTNLHYSEPQKAKIQEEILKTTRKKKKICEPIVILPANSQLQLRIQKIMAISSKYWGKIIANLEFSIPLNYHPKGRVK